MVYFAIAVASGGRLPFACFPMFMFPSANGTTAVPLFTVDGERAEISRYEAFSGIAPDSAYLSHGNVMCSVEHMFQEGRAWITSHPGDGARVCAIGFSVVSLDEDGHLNVEDHVTAEGHCRPR